MIHEHHRRLQSQGGGDEPTNVIGLPDVIHDWVHANPEAAKEAGLYVPEWVDPATVKIIIPEEALKKVRAPRKMEKPRSRATISFKVPKDDREDGAGLFDDYWSQVIVALEEDGITTGGDTGQYAALIALCVYYLSSREPTS